MAVSPNSPILNKILDKLESMDTRLTKLVERVSNIDDHVSKLIEDITILTYGHNYDEKNIKYFQDSEMNWDKHIPTSTRKVE